jgi:hypothetical protein
VFSAGNKDRQINLIALSYADLNRGHEGKIYKRATGYLYGMTGYESGITLNGKLTHRRTINSKYGTSDISVAAEARLQVRCWGNVGCLL